MSHNTTIKNPDLKDKNALVKALKEMFGKKNVEVHDKPVRIQGYSTTSQAEIVVRKPTMGGYGDLGFQRQTDGSWLTIMDDLDTHKVYNKDNGNKNLNNRYARQVALQRLRKMAMSVKEETDHKGRVVIEATIYG